MSFDIPKMQKFEDMVEGQATDYAYDVVFDYFGIDDITQLNPEQIAEIQDFADKNDYATTSMGLRNLINEWDSYED